MLVSLVGQQYHVFQILFNQPYFPEQFLLENDDNSVFRIGCWTGVLCVPSPDPLHKETQFLAL